MQQIIKGAYLRGAPTFAEQVSRSVSVVKSAGEEQYVLGVVLEPTKELNKPDSQGDVYSAEEVRNACFGYMQNYRNIGLQHEDYVNDKVKIVENYIAPVDMLIDGRLVAKGTWLMGVKVLDPELWSAVKDGRITGFSIGGTAQRMPVG